MDPRLLTALPVVVALYVLIIFFLMVRDDTGLDLSVATVLAACVLYLAFLWYMIQFGLTYGLSNGLMLIGVATLFGLAVVGRGFEVGIAGMVVLTVMMGGRWVADKWEAGGPNREALPQIEEYEAQWVGRRTASRKNREITSELMRGMQDLRRGIHGWQTPFANNMRVLAEQLPTDDYWRVSALSELDKLRDAPAP